MILEKESSMLKALYYPHTNISNPLIIKNALLLWDNIETIIPNSNFITPKVPKPRLIEEAIELIVQPRIPSRQEREEAHAILQKLAESGSLSQLLSEAPTQLRHGRYLIYPEKFLSETWHFLERDGIAKFDHRLNDYGLPPVIGFLMMSLLADACAGTQIQKVTDRLDAYNWLGRQRALILGSQHIIGFDASQVAPSYNRLVTLSLDVLDAREIPLKKLIEFRKREIKRGGMDYSAMRRRYLDALCKHVKRIGSEPRTQNDLKELERQFKIEIEQDVSDLKSELGEISKKTLFSKEVGISAVIVAGALTSSVAGLTTLGTKLGVTGIIPLLGAISSLRGARRVAFQRHISSWIYLAKKGKLQVI
jgi:hypothetical protein